MAQHDGDKGYLCDGGVIVVRLAILAILLCLAPLAQADLLVRHDGAGPVTSGMAVVADGRILSHQNAEIDIQAPGIHATSGRMHDHDAFFWSLVQPDGPGVMRTVMKATDGSASSELDVAPTGALGEVGISNGDTVQATSDTPSQVFWRLHESGRLLAWGTTDVSGSADILRLPRGSYSLDATFMKGGHAEHVSVGVSTIAGPADDVLEGLPELAPAEELAACGALHMEPDGPWYLDTHVRISIDPLARMTATDRLDAWYELTGPSGETLAAHINDPFGHVLLSARETGPHTLVVRQGDAACTQAIDVQASTGSIEPIIEFQATPTGFIVSFDADTDTHYDVDAVIRDADERVLFAGKIHSHAIGTSASFDAAPGTYHSIDLYPVAQGPGPSIQPIHERLIFTPPTEVQREPQQFTPAPFAGLAILLAALRRS